MITTTSDILAAINAAKTLGELVRLRTLIPAVLITNAEQAKCIAAVHKRIAEVIPPVKCDAVRIALIAWLSVHQQNPHLN